MIKRLYLLLAAAYIFSVQGVERIDTQIIQGGVVNSCPSDDLRNAAKENVRNAIEVILNSIIPECGEGLWEQVAYLDMSDSEQSCPPSWNEVSSPHRSCAAADSTSFECANPITYSVSGRTYSRVCGRVTGYLIGSPDAFALFAQGPGSINGSYVDGVSITHGSPQQHVWTFAASPYVCPCYNENRNQAPLPPSFVGNNYYCDRDNIGQLWDGQDCTTACCTFNSPPWFSVSLPAPTTDDIEVRICTDQEKYDEDIYVGFTDNHQLSTAPPSIIDHAHIRSKLKKTSNLTVLFFGKEAVPEVR